MGWIGDLGMDSLIPFTCKLMYRPAVLKLMFDAPRDAVTRTVIFARFAIVAIMRDSRAPRPCSVARPCQRTRGTLRRSERSPCGDGVTCRVNLPYPRLITRQRFT